MKYTNRYDAVIIGFGKGGKTLAAALGNAGKKTALIEKSSQMYGGTCINVGCIPTKFLIERAKNSRFFKDKQQYYKQCIDDKNKLVEALRAKNLKKLQNTPNVTVITGVAKLLSDTKLEIATETDNMVFTADQIFLNTGSVPVVPQIDGLNDNPFVFTSDELLKQTKLPQHLVIIGGGYIGAEFASMYADFGSKVTVIQNDAAFLPREDTDISLAVQKSFANRGIELITNADVRAVTVNNDRAVVKTSIGDAMREIAADAVLIATGRRPNTENLGLDNAGVKLNERGGVVTDQHLKTTASNIYAMGDVVGGLQFTYISLDDFRVVRSAVLGDGGYTVDKRGNVPYSVFVNPPFSRIGLSEQTAKQQGYFVKVKSISAEDIPKALVLGQTAGIIKIIIDQKTDLILGAHLFCEQSHELINIIKLVMDMNLPYMALRDMIFTHPTMGEALNDLLNV